MDSPPEGKRPARLNEGIACGSGLSDGFEGGLEVGEDVVDVLGADGQADGIGADALVGELLPGQLAVGRGGRVDDQALDVRDVGEQGEDLQIVDELMGLGLAALDLKGEDGAAAVREVLLVERMVRVVRQRRMVDALDLRMVREEVHDFAGILRVPLKAERERLDALQKKERGKRRDRRAGIAQEDRADIGHEGRGAGRFDEGNAVVAGVRVGDGGIFAAGSPVKAAAVDDDAAERRAVAAEELGGGVDDNIRAVLDGTDEIRRTEGIIDHERQTVLVREDREGVDIRDVAVGVAEGLDVDGSGIGLDGGLDLREIVDVDESGRDAEVREGMLEQVIAAAVDSLLGDEVAAILAKGFERVGDGGCAGGHSQGGDAAFERGDALFQHVLRGVGQSAVDVAGVGEAEAGGSVGAVMEDVGGGGVDRHRAGVGGGIGRFLPDVQLEGLKFICRHDVISFLLSKMCRVSLRFVRLPRHIRPKRKLFRTKIRKLICMVFPAFPAVWNAVSMPTVLVGIRIACNSYLVNRQMDISFRGGRIVAFWRESGYDERTIT